MTVVMAVAAALAFFAAVMMVVMMVTPTPAFGGTVGVIFRLFFNLLVTSLVFFQFFLPQDIRNVNKLIVQKFIQYIGKSARKYYCAAGGCRSVSPVSFPTTR